MDTGGRFAVTIANPLGARQESTTSASLETIVTAVRQFSESLLTNRVSKEVQQEVKALVTHLEVLVTRRQRIAATNSSRSPSVAETRLALQNLKRFLEQEAQKERAKKASASCTSDSLDSSCSRVQAFSPCTGARSPAGLVDPPVTAAAACGSRGDIDSCRGGRRRLHPSRVAPARDKLHLRGCDQPELGEVHELWKPPKPTAVLHAGRVVRLTCSEPHHFLLLQPSTEGQKPDTFDEIVHIATDWAQPMCHPAEPGRGGSADAATRECRLALSARAAPPDLNDRPSFSGCCLMHCRSPAHVERPPLVVANHRLGEASRPHVELAVEKTLELPLLTAEASNCRCNEDASGATGKVNVACCIFRKPGISGGIETSNSDGAAKGPVGKAAVAEQGNFNCASLGSRVALVRWANATVAETSANSDSSEFTGCQASSNQMLSTCSYPSDSDAQKDGECVAKKSTQDSIDIQTSSVVLVQHPEPSSLGHNSIQATPVRLELRVCESCSPEMLVPSTNIVTAADVDLSDWQQPLFCIIDLFRLVRLAAPLGRSESPTEALEVAVGRSRDDAAPVDTTSDAATESATDTAVELEGAIDSESNCGRSKPTLEVVDQVGMEAEAEAVETAVEMASEPQVTPTAFPVVPTAPQDAGAHGRTWSSCEVGQSSGFTKLLLTLDKAAKRRREKARRQRPPRQPTQWSVMGAVAGTSWSGNNSGSHRSRLQQRRPPQPLVSTSLQPSEPGGNNPRRQEMALKLAADSLAALSQSLQQCVRRVHEAAEAMHCSL